MKGEAMDGIKIDPEQVPDIEYKIIAMSICKEMEAMFENPEVKEDFERWAKERSKRTRRERRLWKREHVNRTRREEKTWRHCGK